MNKDTKSLNELRRAIINLKQNNENLYKICSSLYQELQEVKHFVNFKHDDSLESTKLKLQSHHIQSIPQQPSSTSKNVETMNEFPSSVSSKKLRIINN